MEGLESRVLGRFQDRVSLRSMSLDWIGGQVIFTETAGYQVSSASVRGEEEVNFTVGSVVSAYLVNGDVVSPNQPRGVLFDETSRFETCSSSSPFLFSPSCAPAFLPNCKTTKFKYDTHIFLLFSNPLSFSLPPSHSLSLPPSLLLPSLSLSPSLPLSLPPSSSFRRSIIWHEEGKQIFKSVLGTPRDSLSPLLAESSDRTIEYLTFDPSIGYVYWWNRDAKKIEGVSVVAAGTRTNDDVVTFVSAVSNVTGIV